MNFSAELYKKAEATKTVEELIALAKVENIELSAEKAEKLLAELHKNGELSDDELDNVSGGCNDESKYYFKDNERVVYYDGDTKKYGTIKGKKLAWKSRYYQIGLDDGAVTDWIVELKLVEWQNRT